MKTDNLQILEINRLSQEQYEREKANGRINENALYLTDVVESGTSTGSGFTVDTVACFDFAKPPASVEVQQDGILWGTDESEIELEKDGKIEFATPPFFAKVPIVPGDNVEFEPSTTSDGKPVVKINAEGGSSIDTSTLYITAGLNPGSTLGEKATAEGHNTAPYGNYSHAEGRGTQAHGEGSHAEGGIGNQAKGDYSHAEGAGSSIAWGYGSHAEGHYTIARGDYQHVQGKFNKDDTENKYAHIVGNGSSLSNSNAHTVDWNGNAWFAGKIFVGGTGQDDPKAVELGGSGGTLYSHGVSAEIPIMNDANEEIGVLMLVDKYISTSNIRAENFMQYLSKVGMVGVMGAKLIYVDNTTGIFKLGALVFTGEIGMVFFTGEGQDTAMMITEEMLLLASISEEVIQL